MSCTRSETGGGGDDGGGGGGGGCDRLRLTLPHAQVHSLVLNQSRLDEAHRGRARSLFREGEDFGYGVLLRSSFRFKDAVAANNDRSLLAALSPAAAAAFSSQAASSSSSEAVFSVGLHLRHSSMEDVVSE